MAELCRVCPKCKHLMWDDPHQCPSAEYIKARDELFREALDAAERYGITEETEEQWLIKK